MYFLQESDRKSIFCKTLARFVFLSRSCKNFARIVFMLNQGSSFIEMQHLGRTETKDFHYQLGKFDNFSFQCGPNTSFIGSAIHLKFLYTMSVSFIEKDQNVILQTSGYFPEIEQEPRKLHNLSHNLVQLNA